MANEATMTSKGQMTIPKEIRENLGMKAGDRVSFTPMPDGTVLLRVKTGHLMDLAGKLYDKDRETVTVEKMAP